jgi:hypothetical protein
MRKKIKNKNIARWFFQLAVFCLLPAFLLHYGFSRLHELKKRQKLLTIEQKMQKEIVKLENLANTEKFLAQTFFKLTYQRRNSLQRLIDFRKETGNSFELIAFDKSLNVGFKTISLKTFAGDWKKAFKSLWKIYTVKKALRTYSASAEFNYKEVFGPQFIPESIKICDNDTNEYLLKPDVTGKKPCLWVGRKQGLIFLILVDQHILEKKIGLKLYLEKFAKTGFTAGYLYNDAFYSNAGKLLNDRLKFAIKEGIKSDFLPGKVEFNGILKRKINNKLTVFTVMKPDYTETIGIASPNLAVSFFLLLMSPWLVLSFKTVVLQDPIRISLAVKLAFLFVFAGGLPLGVLFFVSYDYLDQKEFVLYDEIYNQVTGYLQNFDERFESEYANQIFKIRKALRQCLPQLKKKGLRPETLRPFAAEVFADMDFKECKMFFIASRSKIIGTKNAIYHDEKPQFFSPDEDELLDERELEIYQALGRFMVDRSNAEPIDEKFATEIELVTETALQTSLLEIQHNFIAAEERITFYGLGSGKSPTYIDLVSARENGEKDYLLIIFWDEKTLEKLYLDRQYLNANRNIQNMQIFVCSEEAGLFYPQNLRKNLMLRNYTDNFSQKPLPPRQFIDLNYQKYLVMGLKGKFLDDFSLFAIYPAKLVKEKINKEKTMLLTAGLITIFIILVLAQLLTASFVHPMKVISQGAIAIKNKNFDIRLPRLGKDEFGDIARVFNATMVDFEELKVAGFIQEQLLPQKVPDTDKFKLYGKSLTLSDVSGDYFDYFQIEENKIGILIGDVQGQGLGSALIMAMAKAGALQLQKFMQQPEQLLQRMHILVCEAQRRSERKEMQMQYLYADENDGRVVLADASGCQPLIIDLENKSYEKICLNSTPLGTREEPLFAEKNLFLQPGQALVLYTDGLPELWRNSGISDYFSNFCQQVANCSNKDPEVFYSNLIDACKQKSNTFIDDLTIIILYYRG